MNELKIFNNEEFGQIRAIEQDGEPWCVGKDVTDILGYKNPRDLFLSVLGGALVGCLVGTIIGTVLSWM